MEQNFHRPIRASHIKEATQEHILLADEPTRAELASRFSLPGIALLRGEFALRHERAGVIAARLRMQAKVTQTCVVSLEPFDTRIDEECELRFVPAQSLPESEGVELDPETLEGPDEIPYTADLLDLGEALAEQLALALTLTRASPAPPSRPNSAASRKAPSPRSRPAKAVLTHKFPARQQPFRLRVASMTCDTAAPLLRRASRSSLPYFLRLQQLWPFLNVKPPPRAPACAAAIRLCARKRTRNAATAVSSSARTMSAPIAAIMITVKSSPPARPPRVSFASKAFRSVKSATGISPKGMQ